MSTMCRRSQMARMEMPPCVSFCIDIESQTDALALFFLSVTYESIII